MPDKDVLEQATPPIFVHHYYARSVRHEWSYPDGSKAKATVKARTEMKLYTGGKAGIKRKSLIHINAWAEQYGRANDPPANTPWKHAPATLVPATKIKVLGWWLFGRHLDASGDLYLALPDNAEKNLNLRVPGVKHYGAWATAKRHKLVHETVNPAWADSNPARTQIGVGEEVDCKFVDGDFPTDVIWSASAGGLDTTVGNSVRFTAPSNAANATVTANVAGTAKFTIKFNVKEPSGYSHAGITSTAQLGQGIAGARMFVRVWFGPMDVSLYRVQVEEVGLDASDVWGRFADFPYTVEMLHHQSDVFKSLTKDNQWVADDYCQTGAQPDIYAGGYTWVCPARWRIPGGPTNSMTGWTQVITLEDDGTMRIDKFGVWVRRTTNDVVTTGP